MLGSLAKSFQRELLGRVFPSRRPTRMNRHETSPFWQPGKSVDSAILAILRGEAPGDPHHYRPAFD